MGLPALFSKSSETMLLGVVITDTTIQAWLLKVNEGVVEPVAHSKGLAYDDDEEALTHVDEGLQQLGPASEEVNEVVFGLESHWVTQAGVADHKKPLLKKITTDLSLEAVGFVVIPEALAQDKTQRDPQLPVILVHLSSKFLELQVLAQGFPASLQQVGRSATISADIQEALARVAPTGQAAHKLPAKLWLTSAEYSEEELKEIQQQLLTLDWFAQEMFVAVPTIQVVPPEQVAQTVMIQGVQAVAASRGEAVVPPTAAAAAAAPLAPTEPLNHDLQPLAATIPMSEETSEPNPAEVEVAPTSFGIPIASQTLPESAKTAPELQQTLEDHPHQPAWRKYLTKKFLLAGFVAGLLLAILTVYGIMTFASTAQVTVTLKSVPVSKEVQLTVDSDRVTSDPDQLILAADQVTQEVSGEKTVETTGVKIVGEPAKGTVTLYNKTQAEKSFGAGTIVKAGEQEFTLDESVTVAAAQVQQRPGGEERNYGKGTASVTAAKIGAEGNLAKATALTVGSFDPNTYSAEVTENFAGGSSREVRVVAEQDRQQALQQLTQQLITEAQTTLTKNASAGQYILPTQDLDITTTEYSDEVGTEADELTLELEGTVTALAYTIEELKPIAQKVLESEVPENYQLVTSDPQIMSAPNQDETEDQTKLTVNISSVAVPKVTEDQIRSQVVGKSVQQATTDLQSQPEVAKAAIAISPGFVQGLGSKIPNNAEKVTVILETPNVE